MHTVAEGNGPVNALDQALRKALLPHYPQLADIQLADYKVRILDGDAATGATTRVIIDTRNTPRRLEHRRQLDQHHRVVVAGVGGQHGVCVIGSVDRVR